MLELPGLSVHSHQSTWSVTRPASGSSFMVTGPPGTGKTSWRSTGHACSLDRAARPCCLCSAGCSPSIRRQPSQKRHLEGSCRPTTVGSRSSGGAATAEAAEVGKWVFDWNACLQKISHRSASLREMPLCGGRRPRHAERFLHLLLKSSASRSRYSQTRTSGSRRDNPPSPRSGGRAG